uniref:G-protein coupled receptors family 1 profile domain-containing protein n=1 Tax=Ditylenchus dipsaci TaxID=166011 RepID=A0A915DYP1_9BILA
MNQAAPYPAIPHEYIVVLVYTLLAITGLFGNIWVMMTVISQLGCRFGSLYIFAAAFNRRSDFFCAVPLLAADIVANRWPFGIGLCKLLWSCEGANKSLSPLILTALSVDRYIAVCRPSFVWLRQTSFALLVIAVCIFISSLFILPVSFKATIGIMEDSNKEEHLKSILRRLYQHTRISTVGRRTSISLSRVVKCSVLVVAFYFICWTPYIWMFRIGAIFSSVTDSLPSNSQSHNDLVISNTPSTTANPAVLYYPTISLPSTTTSKWQ